jgi:hypothetical protein
MPDFMDLLAKGMNDNLSKIQAPTLKLATSLAMTLSPGMGGALGALPVGVSAIPASVTTSQQQIIINVPPNPVNLDGRLVSRALMPSLTNHIRYSVGSNM